MKNYFHLIILVLLASSCSILEKNPIQIALKSNNQAIRTVMENPNTYELQILYTAIKRDKNNKVTLTDYKYHVDATHYFYPASTVKFPIAILALEKLNQIPNTSIHTKFKIEGQPAVLQFSDEISKISG